MIANYKKIGIDRISSSSTFLELDISSLDAIQVLYSVEEEFQVEVPNEVLGKMKSVQDVVNGIVELIREKDASLTGH